MREACDVSWRRTSQAVARTVVTLPLTAPTAPDAGAFTVIIVPRKQVFSVPPANRYSRGRGAIADRVVAVDGQMALRPMMTTTLSSDHRVVDVPERRPS